MLRQLLTLLLCLAVASQAWAAAPSADPPCPMAAEMAAQMMAAVAAGEPLDEALDDCCNDIETFLLTGQACKPIQECQAPLLWLMQPAQQTHVLSPARHLESLPPATSPSGALAPIWRPPTRT
jgi:hypothetical protein